MKFLLSLNASLIMRENLDPYMQSTSSRSKKSSLFIYYAALLKMYSFPSKSYTFTYFSLSDAGMSSNLSPKSGIFPEGTLVKLAMSFRSSVTTV